MASTTRVLLLPLMASALMGFQTQSPGTTMARPTFEVAVIKPNPGIDEHNTIASGVFPGGLFQATNNSLRMLLKRAFHLEDFQIYGAPDWIDSARFDIEAK